MKKYFPVYVRVPVIFFAFFGLIEYCIDSGDKPAFIKYPVISLILLLFIFLEIAIELILKATDTILDTLLTEEQRKQKEIDENRSFIETDFYKNWIQRLTKTEPIENEGQLLLDHDYDGIKELDNNLPPWWVYLFYGCIAFAAIYLVRFEMMDGDNQETELRKEMAQAKIDVEQYMKTAPDMTDEKTVTVLTKPEELAEGKTIFTTNCIACHRADGGGNIGPNLTDEHWILGGGIKNVFHTITNGGRDGKGMIAWSKNGLKPKEIQKVASYVLSLQGSNPKDGKAPDGDIWVNPSAEKTATANPPESLPLKK
ncbi:c-type cytochrome [Flavobacterium psychrophilum]|uniref:Cytochrome c oxidase, cbb3-type, subunit III n=2 Tax=Flavobacterium psychrophilum TaxID=96345 RepID=A6GYS2_FLAPJ|nr:cbb3-type cytochrome c oxidase N-terminal domain-containing protein [Flavobacterium psychrophilum]AIG29957.1 cytochrome C oxidase subunit III [Flavobacterium psychrophilum]AIG32234.1 cytochrome C oxidase subunit III [Flavobacterium psychrophilum]AIG34390.1 cytochrome C oxidase subunit III [Flavobacterium psychrophilum]AIG36753.1 cytochrome C oxidase subunit III [Flavobacterium psychrophilum]AIG39017.1 cytochrome C oxidase subunit III [Flavobacterium psychrophilum]